MRLSPCARMTATKGTYLVVASFRLGGKRAALLALPIRQAGKGSSPPNIHTHLVIGPAPHLGPVGCDTPLCQCLWTSGHSNDLSPTLIGCPSLVSAAVNGARKDRIAQDPNVGLLHDPESSTPRSDAKLKLSWANLSIAPIHVFVSIQTALILG
ncbi:hypothetical protein BDP81DRAFT_129098 [Colletotrichum phormii]|uniref:Uncharacterized protein n=1 Tax=Colletotrichum phormii TaxID=359342 RepID=A0AAJ0A315_9PEZI|nr:uncharacterized protein BDP81DRAFT_129098 [Colletotrichum phormii]KAK1641192.1 hypothetical protein BDP81DRAFT_129098 [Colletotrichum phormii]